MKKGIITMMTLMLGISGMMAQTTLVVAGAGDATLRQGETFEIRCDGSPITFTKDGAVLLTSYKDYDVTLPDLIELKLTGAGDVESKGKLTFPNLHILISGTGDADLNVECDTIKAHLSGIGDLKLNGHCRYLEATVTGLGDLDFNGFTADSIAVVKNGKRNSKDTSNSQTTQKKGLLFNPHWQGVDAGINILLGPGANADFTGDYALLEQRTLRSWTFNFNLADVGIAFTRSHRIGLYTGVGLGWNNFSFNNPVRLEKGEDKLICHAIDEETEGKVRRSKLGVLYIQSPLMIEFRPTKKTFVAIGVTGGFRINTWTKIKYKDGDVEKTHKDYYVNRFKLDASLRAGGSGLGFFANYSLLPFFDESKAPTSHTVSFGMSLNF